MYFQNDIDDAKKLREMVGENDITNKVVDEQPEEERYEIFEGIDVLVHSAKDLYCYKKLGWDEMVGQLAESIEKLKGKESELKELAEEDDEDDNEEESDEDEKENEVN